MFKGINFLDYKENLSKLTELSIMFVGDRITDDLIIVMLKYLKDIKSMRKCFLKITGNILKLRNLDGYSKALEALGHLSEVDIELKGKKVLGNDEKKKVEKILEANRNKKFVNLYCSKVVTVKESNH